MHLVRIVASRCSLRLASKRSELFLEWQKFPVYSTVPEAGPILRANEVAGPSSQTHAGGIRQPAFHQHTQKRFRRHDRASAFSKPRPPTKKQRKAYNRKKKRLAEMAAKHNPPGSQAGPQRQRARERWQELLNKGKESSVSDPSMLPSEQYGLGDALLDDLIGNTAYLTAQTTPKPVYLGHKHERFYKEVANQMDKYRRNVDMQLRGAQTAREEDTAVLDPTSAALPTDKSISNVVCAFRDRFGTRTKPVGLSAALEHLLKDLSVPTFAFGEYAYTALLTCCRTPKEARRIFKLMHDHQHPLSAFSWSILVDIHAKLADFEGCHRVIQEMAANGVPPTQAAYTSLLAACYQVCNNGRVAHSIRAKAGELGWSQWKEMRIVGIEADAMAYGAIIRLCAARGHPERAINLLEEMNRFEVKPTTLCFSSALRAVARSHAVSIRFENGSSRKQLRRETIAAHHGKMARAITIMAENAEVEIDEGFVSALMLCAAEAGDSATAKAVYLAAQVRSMHELRTIGPESHLRRLRGELDNRSSDPYLLDGGGTTVEAVTESLQEPRAMELDAAPYKEAQSGLPSSPVPTPPASYEEREYGRDTRALSALMHACSKAVGKDGIGTLWSGSYNQGILCDNSLRLITERWKPSYAEKNTSGVNSTKLGIASLRRFDEHRKEYAEKPGVRTRFRGLYIDEDSEEDMGEFDSLFEEEKGERFIDEEDWDEPEINHLQGMQRGNNEARGFGKYVPGHERESEVTELYADNGEMRWKGSPHSRPRMDRQGLSMASIDESGDGVDSRPFLQGDEHDGSNPENDHVDSDVVAVKNASKPLQDQPSDGTSRKELYRTSPHDKELENLSNELQTLEAIDSGQPLDAPNEMMEVGVPGIQLTERGIVATDVSTGFSSSAVANEDYDKDVVLRELAIALPGLPLSRLKRIRNKFSTNLGYPSFLELVPILRENMPDYVTSTWLKAMNTRNADFVFERALGDGLIDTHLLNAMLEFKTSTGSINRALEFHQEEFQKHELTPTAYSDRLVIQMFLSNKRLQRALGFKQSIEENGRTLDIAAYGSLLEYCSRHHQLGSAFLLLQECMEIHGAAPSEKYLARIRLLCRMGNLERDLGLDDMIGEDPIKWLKHGEKYLKREFTKKGRRNVQYATNRLLS